MRTRHPFLLLVAAAVLLTSCSAVDGTSPMKSSDAADDRAGTVDLGDGRDLYLECHGTGSPTVVLVSGLGDSAEVWSTRLDEARSGNPQLVIDAIRDAVDEVRSETDQERPGRSSSP